MPDETRRAAPAGGPLRARRLRDGPAERTSRARSSASTSSSYVGEHGLELEPRQREWADADPRVRRRAWAGRSSGSRCRSPSTTGAPPIRRRRGRALERGRAAARRGGLPHALGPHGARGAAAGRRLEGNGRAAPARRRTGSTRALYAGDDTTDLDGFAALDGLEVAVRVAVASPRARRSLRERADIVVGSTDELLELLRGSSSRRRGARAAARTWRRATSSSVCRRRRAAGRTRSGAGAADGGDLRQVHEVRAVDAGEAAGRKLPLELGERRRAEVRAVVGVDAAVVAVGLRRSGSGRSRAARCRPR